MATKEQIIKIEKIQGYFNVHFRKEGAKGGHLDAYIHVYRDREKNFSWIIRYSTYDTRERYQPLTNETVFGIASSDAKNEIWEYMSSYEDMVKLHIYEGTFVNDEFKDIDEYMKKLISILKS